MAPAASPEFIDFDKKAIGDHEVTVNAKHHQILSTISARLDAQNSPDRLDSRGHSIVAVGTVNHYSNEVAYPGTKREPEFDRPAVFTSLSTPEIERFPASMRRQLFNPDSKGPRILRMWVIDGDFIRSAYVGTVLDGNERLFVTGIVQELPKSEGLTHMIDKLDIEQEEHPFQAYVRAVKEYWGTHKRLDDSTLMDLPYGPTMDDIRSQIDTHSSENTVWYFHGNQFQNQAPGELINKKLTQTFVSAEKISVPSICSIAPPKENGPFTQEELTDYTERLEIYLDSLQGIQVRMRKEKT